MGTSIKHSKNVRNGKGVLKTAHEFIAFAKNIRSLSLGGGIKITQLLGELKNTEWDVVLLSETRTPTGKYVLDGGHVLFTALFENSASGTAILLHSKHVKKSNKIHVVNDRVLALDFMAYGIKMSSSCVCSSCRIFDGSF